MKIQLSRVYEIEFDGTAAEFIQFVDRALLLDADSNLDSLDMGDAVHAATELYDNGHITDKVDVVDHIYNYIDCPDKNTVLTFNTNTGTYRVVSFTCSCQHGYGGCLNPVLSSSPSRLCMSCAEIHPNG